MHIIIITGSLCQLVRCCFFYAFFYVLSPLFLMFFFLLNCRRTRTKGMKVERFSAIKVVVLKRTEEEKEIQLTASNSNYVAHFSYASKDG